MTKSVEVGFVGVIRTSRGQPVNFAPIPRSLGYSAIRVSFFFLFVSSFVLFECVFNWQVGSSVLNKPVSQSCAERTSVAPKRGLASHATVNMEKKWMSVEKKAVNGILETSLYFFTPKRITSTQNIFDPPRLHMSAWLLWWRPNWNWKVQVEQLSSWLPWWHLWSARCALPGRCKSEVSHPCSLCTCGTCWWVSAAWCYSFTSQKLR